jgi:TolA-binding protein
VKITEKLFGSKGRDIADFADLCNKDGILDIANEAYSLLIDLGKSSPFYSKAIFGYATVLEQKLNILKKTFPDSIPKDDIHYIISKYDDIAQSSPNTAIASECLFRKSQLQSNFLDDNVSAKKTLELIIQRYTHHSISVLAANELALLLIKDNDSTEAKKILLHNITKASLNPKETDRSQFILAEMMYFEGNIDSAIVFLLPISGKPESDIANDALERLLFIEENKQYVSDLIIFAKAEHYERMRKYSEALPEFKKITAEGDLSELSQIKIAEVYSKLKNINKAIEEYSRFLTLYPESIRTDKVLYTIGEMNILQGEKEKAIISFTDILVRYPNSMYVKKSREIIRKLRGDVH